MKKVIGIIVVFVAFGYTPVTNSTSTSTEINLEKEEFKINCRELAQGYYEYLVEEEEEDQRSAGKKARTMFTYCEAAQ